MCCCWLVRAIGKSSKATQRQLPRQRAAHMELTGVEAGRHAGGGQGPAQELAMRKSNLGRTNKTKLWVEQHLEARFKVAPRLYL